MDACFYKEPTVLLGVALCLTSLNVAEAGKENQGTHETKEITVSHKTAEEGNWMVMEGETVVDAPLHVVFYLFTDVHKSRKITPGVKEKRILKEFSDTDRIEYSHIKLPWPLRDRYTIYRVKEQHVNDHEIVLTMNSVKDYPYEDKGKIRGTVKNSRYTLTSSEIDKSKTHVVVEVNIDPGGWLPRWLVRYHAKKWTEKLFKKLRKQIRKHLAKKTDL